MPPVLLFSALADQTRCTIIEMLRVEPLPVHRLAEAFAISRPAISRHLRVLGEAGLVAERKQGRENIYALQIGMLDDGRTWLDQFGPVKPVVVEPAAIEPVVVRPIKPAPAKPPKPVKAPPQQMPGVGQMEFDL